MAFVPPQFPQVSDSETLVNPPILPTPTEIQPTVNGPEIRPMGPFDSQTPSANLPFPIDSDLQDGPTNEDHPFRQEDTEPVPPVEAVPTLPIAADDTTGEDDESV